MEIQTLTLVWISSSGIFRPLHYAARDNKDAAVAAPLIAVGAEVNAQTEAGATPLQLAQNNPNPQVAETLVKAGARQ